MSRAVTGIILLLLSICLLAGCVTTSATILDEEVVTNVRPMTSYKHLVVKDFELRKDMVSDAPGERLGERDRMYLQLPVRLAENLERYLKSRRIFQQVSRIDIVKPDTLVLKGSFSRVGRFRISIEGMLIDAATGQEVAYFRQTHWDVLDAAESISAFAKEVAYFIDRIQYK